MYKLILVVILISLLIPTTAYAKVDEPLPRYPAWATSRCIETIYRIVQHEAGNTQDTEIFKFIAEHVLRDTWKMGCDHLTQWRWRIGNYYPDKVYYKVQAAVLDRLERFPNTDFPECKLIGMYPDLAVWKSYGYDTTIGYERTVNNLTVIGVNCT